MDVDFPLVLSWAVIVSGSLWLGDVVFFKPRRRRAAEAFANSSKHVDQNALEGVLKEPVIAEYARSFFPVLLLVLLLRSFLVEPYQIPSESMVPTLKVGDFILVNKFAYGIRLPVLGTKIFAVGEPQRGDIMVFIPPHEPRYFIKRVIGLPGDHIRYQNKELTINGERVEQDFVDQVTVGARPQYRIYDEQLGDSDHQIYRYPTLRERPSEWIVPEGSYFMMGDNRGKSLDSRRWGFVEDAKVVGKAFAIWVHKDPGLNWPTFRRNGLIE